MSSNKSDTSSISPVPLKGTGTSPEPGSAPSSLPGGKNGVPHIPLGQLASVKLDPTDHHTISPTVPSHKAARPLPVEETSKPVRPDRGKIL